MVDLAIPTLPCRDLDETQTFYQQLGFGPVYRDDAYLILRFETLEIHFFPMTPLDPKTSYSGCYLRVSDLERLHTAFGVAGLPETGIPRLTPTAERPWGMKEFYLVDLSGNLIRVGQIIEHPRRD